MKRKFVLYVAVTAVVITAAGALADAQSKRAAVPQPTGAAAGTVL